MVYGWARTGTFFSIFTRIDEKSGIPRPALWLTFGLSVFWTLPFPSWEALINVVSAALILSYAVAPVTVAALRRNAPELVRPFKVKHMGLLGPLSFIIAALIVYWSGWKTVSWLLSLQILMFVIYLLCGRFVPTMHLSIAQQVRSSAWLIGFYAMTILLSWLGSFGGLGVITHPLDTIVVALGALGIYYWGAATGVPAHLVQLDAEDSESEIEQQPVHAPRGASTQLS